MTLRLSALTIQPTDDAWLRAPEDGVDITNDETRRVDLLAVVRHIMRDEPCTIVPVVVAACAHPTNRYGHNMQVEVTYSKNGWRAIYGAHAGATVTNVQCYMD